MKPDISVIIPVYNCEKYLRCCVDSVLSSETNPQLQVILVDDGSTDQTPAICDAYQKADERIIVKHIPNGGVSNARQMGMRLAEGEWICFIDSDDYVEKDFFQKMFYASKENDADVICCNSKDEGASNLKNISIAEKKYITDKGKLLDDYFAGARYPHVIWSKIFRKSFLEKVEFTRLAHTEDTNMMLQTIFLGGRFILIPYVGYHYVINPESVMSTSKKKSIYSDRLVTLQYLTEQCQNLDVSYQKLAQEQVLRSLYIWLSVILNSDDRFDRNEIVSVCRHYVQLINWELCSDNHDGRKIRQMLKYPGIVLRIRKIGYHIRAMVRKKQ